MKSGQPRALESLARGMTGIGSRTCGLVRGYCIWSRRAGAWNGSLRLEGNTFHSPVS